MIQARKSHADLSTLELASLQSMRIDIDLISLCLQTNCQDLPCAFGNGAKFLRPCSGGATGRAIAARSLGRQGRVGGGHSARSAGRQTARLASGENWGCSWRELGLFVAGRLAGLIVLPIVSCPEEEDARCVRADRRPCCSLTLRRVAR